MINPKALPQFSRLHEWFGPALMEPTRGMRMFEHMTALAKSGALAAHMEAELARKAAASEEARREEQAEKKLYAVELVALAAAGDSAGGAAAAGGSAVRVAVIDIMGTLMKSPSSMDDATSTVYAREQVRAAAADDTIDAILVRIDSPGGYVAGTEDLAAAIRAAAEKKPLAAYVEDLCASAAYWCACAAPAIYANNPTAEIGSIGVLMAFYEATGMAGQLGLKPVVVATGQFKGMGFPGTEITAEQRALLQESVDSTMDQFVAAVMTGRHLTDKQVRLVGTGQVYKAADAQKSGLIDGIMTFEQVLGSLATTAKQKIKTKNSGGSGGARRATESTPLSQEVVMTTVASQPGAAVPPIASTATPAATLQELKAALPKSTADFREKCIEEGLTLAQATGRYVTQADAALESSREQIATLEGKGKKIGVPAVKEGGPAQGAQADAGDFDALVRTKMKDSPSMERREAIKAVARAHPEAHAAYVAGMPKAKAPSTARTA